VTGTLKDGEVTVTRLLPAAPTPFLSLPRAFAQRAVTSNAVSVRAAVIGGRGRAHGGSQSGRAIGNSSYSRQSGRHNLLTSSATGSGFGVLTCEAWRFHQAMAFPERRYRTQTSWPRSCPTCRIGTESQRRTEPTLSPTAPSGAARGRSVPEDPGLTDGKCQQPQHVSKGTLLCENSFSWPWQPVLSGPRF
jgi:hypothetical protein